jgi:hypothetical protein
MSLWNPSTKREERIYMKLNLTSIANMDRFLDIVAQCKGTVSLHLPDHSICDLKQNPLARQFLKLGDQTQESFSLHLGCPSDFPLFLQYMMEAARA